MGPGGFFPNVYQIHVGTLTIFNVLEGLGFAQTC